MPPKTDWPARLPDGGLLNVSRDALVELAVRPFQHRDRRVELTGRLFLWLDEVAALGVPLRIWVDGSYATTKPEPDDIDLCVLVDPAALNTLDDDQYARFEQLMDRAYVKAGYLLDVYVVDQNDTREQNEWLEMFGKGHDRKTVKGIFAMRATP